MPSKRLVLNTQKSGIAAAIVFTVIVLVGIATENGFNAIDQVISTLYEAGARDGRYFQAAFIFYNVLLAVFGLSIFLSAGYFKNRIKVGKSAGIITALCAIAGVVDDLSPQDRIGATLSATGQLHWISTGIAFLLMLTSIVLSTLWIHSNFKKKSLVYYSIATMVVIVGAGSVGNVAVPMLWPHMGIYETLVMFVFLLWIVFLSINLKGFVEDYFGGGNKRE